MPARVAPTTLETAPQASQPILAQLKQALGMVPNLYATVGHSAAALGALLAWDKAIAGANNLTKREIELVNLRVSELNGCGYCLAAHSAMGKMAGLSPDEVEQARRGQGKSARENGGAHRRRASGWRRRQGARGGHL
jgi:AhpD family alkylhydroperoxidase